MCFEQLRWLLRNSKTTGDDADSRMPWDDAMAWVDSLNSSNHLGYNDWRLPVALPVNGSSYVITDPAGYDGSTDTGYNITSPNSEMSYMYYIQYFQ